MTSCYMIQGTVWRMRSFMYYFSGELSEPSPPTNQLRSVEADSAADVPAKLIAELRLTSDQQAQWIHVLVWTSNDGKQRGFESSRVR